MARFALWPIPCSWNAMACLLSLSQHLHTSHLRAYTSIEQLSMYRYAVQGARLWLCVCLVLACSSTLRWLPAAWPERGLLIAAARHTQICGNYQAYQCCLRLTQNCRYTAQHDIGTMWEGGLLR